MAAAAKAAPPSMWFAPNSTKVRASGPGLEKVHFGKFLVDTQRAGKYGNRRV